jgi:hypothetical protein
MKPENVLNILEQAILFDEKDLETKCWQVIEWRTSKVVSSENFVNIKQTTLASLLKRNRLDVTEVQLFQTVLKWIDHQCSQKGLELTTENRRSVIGDAVYDLRFIAMNQGEFATHVSKSGLLIAEELVPIYEKINKLDAPLLKWKLPKREIETFTASNERIRISRFPRQSQKVCSTHWQYGPNQSNDFVFGGHYKEMPQTERDYLSFSVDQCALFVGVRFFAESEVPQYRQYNNTYCVKMSINGSSTEDMRLASYTPQKNVNGISGFDVMLKSPILVRKDEVVKMEAQISGPPSPFGRYGKSEVKVKGVTVRFYDSDICSTRTCVSQGQFHEIILSV